MRESLGHSSGPFAGREFGGLSPVDSYIDQRRNGYVVGLDTDEFAVTHNHRGVSNGPVLDCGVAKPVYDSLACQCRMDNIVYYSRFGHEFDFSSPAGYFAHPSMISSVWVDCIFLTPHVIQLTMYAKLKARLCSAAAILRGNLTSWSRPRLMAGAFADLTRTRPHR